MVIRTMTEYYTGIPLTDTEIIIPFTQGKMQIPSPSHVYITHAFYFAVIKVLVQFLHGMKYIFASPILIWSFLWWLWLLNSFQIGLLYFTSTTFLVIMRVSLTRLGRTQWLCICTCGWLVIFYSLASSVPYTNVPIHVLFKADGLKGNNVFLWNKVFSTHQSWLIGKRYKKVSILTSFLF